MKQFGGSLLAWAFVLVCLLTPAQATNQEFEKQALKVSEAWLALFDQGKYAETWHTAADYFKQAVTEADWTKRAKNGRSPLGHIVTRTLRGAKYMTTLPGAPKGEYVVIQFQSNFEHKESAIETITPMRDKQGNWKVSGYYIR